MRLCIFDGEVTKMEEGELRHDKVNLQHTNKDKQTDKNKQRITTTMYEGIELRYMYTNGILPVKRWMLSTTNHKHTTIMYTHIER